MTTDGRSCSLDDESLLASGETLLRRLRRFWRSRRLIFSFSEWTGTAMDSAPLTSNDFLPSSTIFSLHKDKTKKIVRETTWCEFFFKSINRDKTTQNVKFPVAMRVSPGGRSAESSKLPQNNLIKLIGKWPASNYNCGHKSSRLIRPAVPGPVPMWSAAGAAWGPD